MAELFHRKTALPLEARQRVINEQRTEDCNCGEMGFGWQSCQASHSLGLEPCGVYWPLLRRGVGFNRTLKKKKERGWECGKRSGSRAVKQIGWRWKGWLVVYRRGKTWIWFGWSGGCETQVCITPANRARPCPRGCVPPPSHGAFIPLGSSAEEVGSFLWIIDAIYANYACQRIGS